MNSGCIPLESLQRIGALPEGHADRAHLDRCPRCQSMLRLLHEFESASTGAEEDPAAREARFEAIVNGMFDEPPAAPAARVARLPVRRHRRTHGLGVVVRVLAGTGILVGSLVLAALVLRQVRPTRGVPESDSAAGDRDQAPLPAGSRLGWPRVEGAEEYRVLVYDRALEEIACVGPVRETTLVLSLGALPATVQPGDTLLWRVEALAGPDVLERSPTRMVVAR